MAETPRKVCKGTWKELYHRCFLHNKFRKTKTKTSQEKELFFNAEADTDVNADTDAEMPMPRFPNGHLIKLKICPHLFHYTEGD